MLRGALQAYRLDIGRYPTTSEGIAALMHPPPQASAFWRGPYLADELPLDPWRTPYVYVSPIRHRPGLCALFPRCRFDTGR